MWHAEGEHALRECVHTESFKYKIYFATAKSEMNSRMQRMASIRA